MQKVRVGQFAVVDRQLKDFLPSVFASHALGQTFAGPSGKRHPIAAVAQRVPHGLRWVGPGNARHHVVAHVHPAPPGVVDGDALERRELAVQAVHQLGHVDGVGRIGTRDGAAAADLHAVVGQQAVIEAQRARVGDGDAGLEARGLQLGRRERARDDDARECGHQAAGMALRDVLLRIAIGGDDHMAVVDLAGVQHDHVGRASLLLFANADAVLHLGGDLVILTAPEGQAGPEAALTLFNHRFIIRVDIPDVVEPTGPLTIFDGKADAIQRQADTTLDAMAAAS